MKIKVADIWLNNSVSADEKQKLIKMFECTDGYGVIFVDEDQFEVFKEEKNNDRTRSDL